MHLPDQQPAADVEADGQHGLVRLAHRGAVQLGVRAVIRHGGHRGRKNGSSRIPVTTATANEYPAIRPKAAAQRSSGSRRSASRTRDRVPATILFAADERGGLGVVDVAVRA